MSFLLWYTVLGLAMVILAYSVDEIRETVERERPPEYESRWFIWFLIGLLWPIILVAIAIDVWHHR